MPLAAQLYTVRDLLARDYVGTLHRVQSAGFRFVELAGFGPYTAKELRRILADVGLTPCSGHWPIEQLDHELNVAIDEAKTLDLRYMVCPYLPEERRRTPQDWLDSAALLDRAGHRCRQNGITLCYHNHSFEFVRVGEQSALELIYSQTQPNHVQAELDTYWVQYGGDDPVGWLDRLSGRCPLLHLKDMASDAERSFVPVGTGVLDWGLIFAAAKRAGVEWGIVEQDTCAGDPIESLTLSLQYILSMP